MMNMNIRMIEYHRNGVSGNGFHVVLFRCRISGRKWQRFVATVFSEPGSVAVLEVDQTALGNICYPENQWRGDHFEPELRAAIAATYDDIEVA